MRKNRPRNNACCQGRVRWRMLTKTKSRKAIKDYRPKFYVQKNLIFSDQKKLASAIEKITNNFIKAFENFKSF